ncbi:hypothetical protein PSDVSF_16180 [Pseudodesulfovibrio sediminis]|uniref:Uncharacterized protein n=1 Tax=Pseudodesulfovibrio sediminis TaxID=2810563 RepID=A0ABM7P6D5_9BACT|nr:hypothetical protein PSDVSF_16180 [Pseudodesulfovibrio sediminis]
MIFNAENRFDNRLFAKQQTLLMYHAGIFTIETPHGQRMLPYVISLKSYKLSPVCKA